jgi:hypothetical protein
LAVELKKIVGPDIKVTYLYSQPESVDGEEYAEPNKEEIY